MRDVMVMMMRMGRRCEDCGNQAKKECVYMRCRTCCKTKAFHCPTHIKSTWVPAYTRSHRHHQPLPTKRLREQHTSSSSGVHIHTCPVHFPAELSCMADFRCVKVSSIDDGKEQYAYQTTVNIGGHVFRGILHNQGKDEMMVDHPHPHPHDQDLLPPSTSNSCPLIITSPFTDFMSGPQFPSHQKP